MRLVDLKIHGFGKLAGCAIGFDPGCNIVFGLNEAGKSTVHAFVRAMLFGLKRARGIKAQTDTWSRYKPWKCEQYGGELRIENDGHIYRIERDFIKDPVGMTVYDESAGENIEDPNQWLKNVLCGMSEETYDNTVSIKQLKSATDASMAQEIREYLVNTNSTGHPALNCEKAKEYLKRQKEELSALLLPDASRDYANNSGEIRKLEAKLSEQGFISRIDELEESKRTLDAQNQEIVQRIEMLSGENEACRKELTEKGFASSDEVAASEDLFTETYNRYMSSVNESNVGSKRAAWIVLTLFFFIFGMMMLSVLRYKEQDIVSAMTGISPAIIFLIASAMSAVCFIAAVVFFCSTINEKYTIRKNTSQLRKALKKFGEERVDNNSIGNVYDAYAKLRKDAVSMEDTERELCRLREEQEEKDEKKRETELLLEEEKQNQDRFRDSLDRLRELREAGISLKKDMENNDAVSFDIEAIELALETIEKISRDYKDSVGLYLNNTVSKYIRSFTNHSYEAVIVEDNWDVKLSKEGRLVPVDVISSGTSDQVYLALRLASADIVQKHEQKLPLVFDDSFVNYDETRLQMALYNIMRTLKNQILIFTCGKREKDALNQLNVQYKLIEL